MLNEQRTIEEVEGELAAFIKEALNESRNLSQELIGAVRTIARRTSDELNMYIAANDTVNTIVVNAKQEAITEVLKSFNDILDRTLNKKGGE